MGGGREGQGRDWGYGEGEGYSDTRTDGRLEADKMKEQGDRAKGIRRKWEKQRCKYHLSESATLSPNTTAAPSPRGQIPDVSMSHVLIQTQSANISLLMNHFA